MIKTLAMKKGLQWSGNYILENGDDFFKLLPYLYKPLEGDWKVVILEPSIADARRIIDCQDIPECLEVEVYLPREDLEVLELERPTMVIEKLSPYDAFLRMIAALPVIVDPNAASAIYNRAGPDPDALKTALNDIMQVCDEDHIMLKDVNKILLDNRRVYASDVVRAFIGPRNINHRWYWVEKLIEELGNDVAYYSVRKYIRRLLVNKNKYMLNEDVAKQFERDVKEIDSYTIAHAYTVFCEFDKPSLFFAALNRLERRNHASSYSTR